MQKINKKLLIGISAGVLIVGVSFMSLNSSLLQGNIYSDLHRTEIPEKMSLKRTVNTANGAKSINLEYSTIINRAKNCNQNPSNSTLLSADTNKVEVCPNSLKFKVTTNITNPAIVHLAIMDMSLAPGQRVIAYANKDINTPDQANEASFNWDGVKKCSYGQQRPINRLDKGKLYTNEVCNGTVEDAGAYRNRYQVYALVTEKSPNKGYVSVSSYGNTVDRRYGIYIYDDANEGTAQPVAPTPAKVEIKEFAPTAATIGSTVTIVGSGFNSLRDASNRIIVSFGKNTDGIKDGFTAVVPESDGQIKVKVPNGAVSGKIYLKKIGAPASTYIASRVGLSISQSQPGSIIAVTPTNGETATITTPVDNTPAITGFSPNSGVRGNVVTIYGKNFDKLLVDVNGIKLPNLNVYFGSKKTNGFVVDMDATSNGSRYTKIQVNVPTGAESGRLKLEKINDPKNSLTTSQPFIVTTTTTVPVPSTNNNNNSSEKPVDEPLPETSTNNSNPSTPIALPESTPLNSGAYTIKVNVYNDTETKTTPWRYAYNAVKDKTYIVYIPTDAKKFDLTVSNGVEAPYYIPLPAGYNYFSSGECAIVPVTKAFGLKCTIPYNTAKTVTFQFFNPSTNESFTVYFKRSETEKVSDGVKELK